MARYFIAEHVIFFCTDGFRVFPVWSSEDMELIEEKNAAEAQTTVRETAMDAEDDMDDDEAEPETIGAIARLGLRAELMPVAQRDWESAVCLGDSSDEEEPESGSGGIGSGVRAAQGKR